MPRERRRATARMHARVREFALNMPALVRSADQHLRFATELLRLAHETPPGNEFTLAGACYLRRVPVDADTGPRLIAAGSTVDPVFLEHEAFWTWAMIEVLRHAGIRIEELLELTHHSIRPYRKPDGAIIPLLQTAPSKTDVERVIPANPELASVLARIISRVANADGSIPLVSSRDEHERSWSDPMPFLFPIPTRRTAPDVQYRHSARIPRPRGRARRHRFGTGPARLPALVHHRRRQQRAADAHRR